MAEILKTGIIPSANALTYEEHQRISDSSVGKYISLTESKNFYCTGIGLDLSTPNTDTNAVINKFSVNKNRYREQELPYGPAYGSLAGYLLYDNLSPDVNNVQGVNLTDVGINVTGWYDIGKVNTSIDAIAVPSSSRLLTVNQSGTYTFKFAMNGDLRFYRYGSKNNGFRNVTIKTELNVNGTVYPIHNGSLFPVATVGIYTFDSRANPLQYNINYTKSLDLVQGDVVQLYTKIFIDNANESNNKNEDLHLHSEIRQNDFQLSIEQQTISGPTQTYFSNPHNINQFKTKSIAYYGNSKDTLKLIGNKLTS